MDLFKVLVLGLLAAIVVSLGNGLFHLVKGQSAAGRGPGAEDQHGDRGATPAQPGAGRLGGEHSRKMVRALRIRVGLSVTLFIVLMLGWYFGLIAPHGLGH